VAGGRRVTTDPYFEAAIEEAREGFAEGGLPIGSVIVIDGEIIGRGRNQRVQRNSAILHAEMDALENAGRRPKSDYARATLYTTLAPCHMCAGAVLRSGIPKVVVGENSTIVGAEAYLAEMGVEVVILGDPECIDLMARFVALEPALWDEDKM
jgi:creatinine deaminase